MTRLTPDLLVGVPSGLQALDRSLLRSTGVGLADLASRATGRKVEALQGAVASVVPMTCGMGRIDDFGESVVSVLSHLGVEASLTEASDASGLAEAVEAGAEMVFLADDARFVAINVFTREVADNTTATARGFVEALDLACGGVKRRSVAVVGAGPLGKAATAALRAKGADVVVVERDPVRARAAGCAPADMRDILPRSDLILNASPSPVWGRWLRQGAIVSSPGVPYCFDEEAERKAVIIHDPLQTGVAVMAYQACSDIHLTRLAENKEVAHNGC